MLLYSFLGTLQLSVFIYRWLESNAEAWLIPIYLRRERHLKVFFMSEIIKDGSNRVCSNLCA